MNIVINILIILIMLFQFNECNEIEKLKKEMNNLKKDFEYVGNSMLKRVTEFKEEVSKDMEDSFKGTNAFMLRLERDLDKANKNNAELSLKFNQTINQLDSNIKNNELFKKQASIIYLYKLNLILLLYYLILIKNNI